MILNMKPEKPIVNRKYKLEKFPGKGGWTYIILAEDLQKFKGRSGAVRVKGTIDDCPISQYSLMPVKGGQLFLPIRNEIRKKIHKEAGDYVTVILFTDNSPLEIPDELMVCFNDDPDAYTAFLNYSPGQQKVFIDWINAAKRTDTKVDRIVKTLNKIAAGKKLYDPD